MSRVALLLGAALSLLWTSCSARAAENADWTKPIAPFRIAGNLYYVGSRDLAAYLVITSQGNILINQNLESSPPQIRASVEKLGFQWADTRVLLNNQAHYDHVAGTAQIAKETGAKVVVMEYDAAIMEGGGRNDFSREVKPFPAVHVDRILRDGDTVTVGDTVLTPYRTAGHTRGCTTWTMDVMSHDHVQHVVIVGGVAPLDDYRLVDTETLPTSYPNIAQDFRQTFVTLRGLPCDIFLGAHGLYFNMLAKLERLPREGDRVWMDAGGYQNFVGAAADAFEARLKRQLAKQDADPWPPQPEHEKQRAGRDELVIIPSQRLGSLGKGPANAGPLVLQ